MNHSRQKQKKGEAYMRKFVCTVCGYIYDEEIEGSFDELPNDWVCPVCGVSKEEFVLEEDN